MAQDSHDHNDHTAVELAHGEHAHGEHDDHHHEGPIVHTELVPEKSAEDSFLLGILSLCFVALLWTVGQWSMTIKADPHHLEGVEHEQTSGPATINETVGSHGHEVAPTTPTPAAHETTPGPEGAPIAPVDGNDVGTNPGPAPASTTGEVPITAPDVAPIDPATGKPNPAWTGTAPAKTDPAWTGTQPPAQPVTTPATTEANH